MSLLNKFKSEDECVAWDALLEQNMLEVKQVISIMFVHAVLLRK